MKLVCFDENSLVGGSVEECRFVDVDCLEKG